MDTLTSMKKKLSPLGLYRLQNSNIADELYVYAMELDRLREESDRILSEAFLSTAQDEGLSMRERMYGKPREELTVNTRREMIEKRFCLGLSDFTLDGLRTALDSFRLTYTICEYPALNKLIVLAQGDYAVEVITFDPLTGAQKNTGVLASYTVSNQIQEVTENEQTNDG